MMPAQVTRPAGPMDLSDLEQLLDEHGIGDPGVVELLDREVPEFREDVFGAEDSAASVIWMSGVASLFRDPVEAYDLLRRMRSVIESRGPTAMKQLYADQYKVWRARRDKSQHDLQYLRIVLGVTQPLEEEE